MKPSIQTKLETLYDRLEELNALLADPGVISDQNKFREFSKEYSQINPVVDCYKKYKQNVENISEAQGMLKDSDPEMRALGEEEFAKSKAEQEHLEFELQRLLLPTDPDDEKNIFLEIRAGTGGDEAALFAGDLYRMYATVVESEGGHVPVPDGQTRARGRVQSSG